jgi:hypothetical protein
MSRPEPRAFTWSWCGIAVVTSLASAALAACGGGDGPELHIHFASDELTARFFHGQQAMVNTASPDVTCSVGGTVDPVPQGEIHVAIVPDAPVLKSNVGLSATPPNGFGLTLMPATDLAPGTYVGSIEVQAFQDAALTQPYRVSGGTLHYAFTVDPQLTISAKIDGVLQTQTFTSSQPAVTQVNPSSVSTIYWQYGTPPLVSWKLHAGQVLELEANMPVTWYGPDRTSASFGYLFPLPTVTSTTFRQTLPSPATTPFGAVYGASYLAMPVAPGQWGTGLRLDLAP